MNWKNPVVFVAGHICLDIIPAFTQMEELSDHQKNSDAHSDSGIDSKEPPSTINPSASDSLSDIYFKSGGLTKVGPLSFHTGGVVANTGIALTKLGLDVRLIGSIGNDTAGTIIKQLLSSYQKNLSENLIKKAAESTSYSIVLNPPGIDRSFLHHPGTNHTFKASDLPQQSDLSKGVWFHFGYPPLMKSIYENEGEELEAVFKRAKAVGLITSLDMATPDDDALDRKVDWHQILNRVLPYVDLFAPSWDEILLLLKKEGGFGHSESLGPDAEPFSITAVKEVALELLEMGCPLVVIKLGDRGMYLKSGSELPEPLLNLIKGTRDQLEDRSHRPSDWRNLEMLVPCFNTAVRGTTGAGDTTIAGLIAGMMKLHRPVDAANAAAATGAYCVSQQDATSGIPSWDKILEKVKDPDNKLLNFNPGPDWNYDQGVWIR